MKTVPKVFRFSRNELDLGRYELRRAGRRLPLSRIPMEFLILLLERRGQLVTREEIVARLWPNPESIDIAQGINSAVKRIRAILNDDAVKPRFIETVVGKGYRFIADVEEVVEEHVAQPPLINYKESDHEETDGSPSRLAASVEKVTFIYTPDDFGVQRPRKRRSTKVISAVVCFSLLVAFAAWFWKRASQEHASSAKRISNAKEHVFQQITTLIPENRATAAAISPDGRLTVYANVDGIFLRTESGETHAVSAPANLIVDRLAWFPDVTKIVASGFASDTRRPSLWIVSAVGAPARFSRLEAREGTPSPDGTRIVFLSADRLTIWAMGASGEDAHLIVRATAGDRIEFVFWSADGRRIYFKRLSRSLGRSIQTYESADAVTGKILSEIENDWISSAAPLADGRILFLRWDTENYTSSNSLWELPAVANVGAAIQGARRIAELSAEGTGESLTLLGLSATADGTRASMLRRSDQNSIFVGNLEFSPLGITNVHRLTLDESNNFPHAWTADSRYIIFESNRNGSYDLFRQGLNQRTAEAIVSTPATEILPQLAAGGRYVLYAAHARQEQKGWFYKPRTYKLMRVLTTGGTPEEVPLEGNIDEFRCPLDMRHGCVLRAGRERSATYYELDPVVGRGRELAKIELSGEILGDWDVSPDGTKVAIPNHDGGDGQIRVITLSANVSQRREVHVVLPGVNNLRGLVWAADGRHWFVSTDTSVGNQLLYVDEGGKFQSLGDIQGWAVPAPDGHHLAFLDRTTAANVWMARIGAGY